MEIISAANSLGRSCQQPLSLSDLTSWLLI